MSLAKLRIQHLVTSDCPPSRLQDHVRVAKACASVGEYRRIRIVGVFKKTSRLLSLNCLSQVNPLAVT
jgi:hypothetical protein